MTRALLPSLLVSAVLLGVLLIIPTPVRAASQSLSLASASLTGNLSYGTNLYGSTGAYLQQGIQRFSESSLLSCEVVWTTTGGGQGGLGTSTWNIGTQGGQRSMYSGSGPAPGLFSWYSNFCANGYNESTQMLVHASMYLSGNGASPAGSAFFGYGYGNGAVNSLCGPAVQFKFTGTTSLWNISSISTAIGVTYNPASSGWLYGAISNPSPPLPSNHWYDIYLWQNKSTQQATITGAGRTVKVSSAFSWSVTNCALPGHNDEAGIAFEKNQTGGGLFAITNVTIGASGASAAGVPQRAGYVTFANVQPPAQLSEIDVSYLAQPQRWNPSGPTYNQAASASLCPCYVNSSSGVTLWSQASGVSFSTYYNATTAKVFPTGVVAGMTVDIAFRFNATDALPNLIITQVSIPGPIPWTNPTGTGGTVAQADSWLPALIFVAACAYIGGAFFFAWKDIWTK